MSVRVQGMTMALLLAVGSLMGCDRDSVTESANFTEAKEVLQVTASIVPQEYFVEKIGGDKVEVNVMVKPGDNLHTYEPKSAQLRALSEADAYISIGVPFEKAWMERIQSANPQMLVVDSAKGIDRMPMVAHHHEEEAHEHEAHEHEEEHSAETLDPHIWLSPKLVKVQAQNIYEALVQLDPDRQAEYKTNLDNFVLEIDGLDVQIRQNLAGVKNRKFVVFHPAWGYFARDYNLEQEPIEVGGQEPSAAELAKVISEAKAEGIQVVFAQPEFSSQSAETIARELDGKVWLISPLASDWADNLLRVSKTFADVLESVNSGQ